MFWKNRNDKSGNTSKQCGQDYLSSNPKTDYQAEKDLSLIHIYPKEVKPTISDDSQLFLCYTIKVVIHDC